MNCSSNGDVTITGAAKADETEEIGGIAGVWHNEDGKTVTFSGCSFTGTLTVNLTEGVDLSDNTIVGNAYNSDGKGILIIDGNAVVVNDGGLEAAVNGGYTTMTLAAGTYYIPEVCAGKL